jgi:hypothetical protein
MKGWRPEGWVNPHSIWREWEKQGRNTEHFGYYKQCEAEFEIGADAMLGALRRQGRHYGAGPMPLIMKWRPAGCEVFIPDGDEGA